jgi:hypothetical protein
MMDAVKAALVLLDVRHTQIKTEAFGTIKRDPTTKDAGSKEIAGLSESTIRRRPYPIFRRCTGAAFWASSGVPR